MFQINHRLTLNDIQHIISNNLTLTLSNSSEKAIVSCRAYLDAKMQDANAVFYGINTGFGSLCNTQISKDELSTLQRNLLLSHACGTGQTVAPRLVKLMLLLKIQSLSYGHSGVSLATVKRLIDFYNLDLLPVVYEQGSLGASGDLAPLAHLSLPLLGEGSFWVKVNEGYVVKEAAEVLKTHGLEPIELQSKEGLALINGTQFMSALAVDALLQAEKQLNFSNLIASISLDAFDGRIEPFFNQLHAIRPHAGQIWAAKAVQEFLSGSEILVQPKTQVQDPYAFRCIPQVHGASYDAIMHVKAVVETEINAVTDNPNIFPEEDLIVSGGNFHGQPLALSLDFLAIALAEIGSISERRTYQLISGLRNLPAFLTPNPGLNSGFMIPQYTAASIVSQNKQLCTPASVDSIVSSNGQEDHVSMGANAATKCQKVVDNIWTILAIELMNAAQALTFKRPLKSSNTIEQFVADYRKHVSALTNDRYLHTDIIKTIEFLKHRQ